MEKLKVLGLQFVDERGQNGQINILLKYDTLYLII